MNLTTSTLSARIIRGVAAACVATLLGSACTVRDPSGLGSLGFAGATARPVSTSGGRDLVPVSVKHVGSLKPAGDVTETIAGNTVIIKQPWVGISSYQLRENPVYFRKDGTADSPDWVGVRWTSRDGNLCMNGSDVRQCYTTYMDSKGQAYLMDHSSKLLALVSDIEAGDSRQMRRLYEQTQRRREAHEQMQIAFAGLLFEALLGGGSGGRGGGGGMSDSEQHQAQRYAEEAEARRRADADQNAAAAREWEQRQYPADPLNR